MLKLSNSAFRSCSSGGGGSGGEISPLPDASPTPTVDPWCLEDPLGGGGNKIPEVEPLLLAFGLEVDDFFWRCCVTMSNGNQIDLLQYSGLL